MPVYVHPAAPPNSAAVVCAAGYANPQATTSPQAAPTRGMLDDIDAEMLLRLPVVVEKVHKCKSSIYEDVRDGTFPAPIKIGARAVAWRASDILCWMRDPSAWAMARRA